MQGELIGPVFAVAGNAPSLAAIQKGQILTSDRIVRINNFFFEPQSFLGRRVDLAVMGGDPRVAPFMFETLWQQRSFYDLRAWTSHNPRVARAGLRRFRNVHLAFPSENDAGASTLGRDVSELIAKYACKPMTGTYAALCAYYLGAGTIILAGMDFYQGSNRYAFTAAPGQRELLGEDINHRKIDANQHNASLDLAILERLNTAMGGKLRTVISSPLLDQIADIAPVRKGPTPKVEPTNAPLDWASRVGFYPRSALRILRVARRWTRKS